MEISFLAKRFLITVFLFAAVVILGIYSYSELSKGPLREEYARTQKFIKANPNASKIFGEVMDEAKICMEQAKSCKEIKGKDCKTISYCREHTRKNIYSNLKGSEALERFPSTYFIRLSGDKTIEKLFLSGEFKVSQITTEEEKYIADLLNGKRQGPTLSGLRVNEVYSNMAYLQDLPSEAEIVVPVEKEGEVMGAFVRLYGD